MISDYNLFLRADQNGWLSAPTQVLFWANQLHSMGLHPSQIEQRVARRWERVMDREPLQVDWHSDPLSFAERQRRFQQRVQRCYEYIAQNSAANGRVLIQDVTGTQQRTKRTDLIAAYLRTIWQDNLIDEAHVREARRQWTSRSSGMRLTS